MESWDSVSGSDGDFLFGGMSKIFLGPMNQAPHATVDPFLWEQREDCLELKQSYPCSVKVKIVFSFSLIVPLQVLE
jgi:hypothetical protein